MNIFPYRLFFILGNLLCGDYNVRFLNNTLLQLRLLFFFLYFFRHFHKEKAHTENYLKDTQYHKEVWTSWRLNHDASNQITNDLCRHVPTPEVSVVESHRTLDCAHGHIFSLGHPYHGSAKSTDKWRKDKHNFYECFVHYEAIPFVFKIVQFIIIIMVTEILKLI